MITSSNTPKRPRLWKSYAWMLRKYYVEKLTEAEIAALAGTSQVTINKWLKLHGLKK
jgi:DNA-binding transcriptional regulator LsrR (DeoR family)